MRDYQANDGSNQSKDGGKQHPQAVKWKSLSPVWLFSMLWPGARQALLSMGFSRQEYWSRVPFPSPGDLPSPGIEPSSPALQVESLLSVPPGKPRKQAQNHNKLAGWKVRMLRKQRCGVAWRQETGCIRSNSDSEYYLLIPTLEHKAASWGVWIRQIWIQGPLAWWR